MYPISKKPKMGRSNVRYSRQQRTRNVPGFSGRVRRGKNDERRTRWARRSGLGRRLHRFGDERLYVESDPFAATPRHYPLREPSATDGLAQRLVRVRSAAPLQECRIDGRVRRIRRVVHTALFSEEAGHQRVHLVFSPGLDSGGERREQIEQGSVDRVLASDAELLSYGHGQKGGCTSESDGRHGGKWYSGVHAY